MQSPPPKTAPRSSLPENAVCSTENCSTLLAAGKRKLLPECVFFPDFHNPSPQYERHQSPDLTAVPHMAGHRYFYQQRHPHLLRGIKSTMMNKEYRK
nr:hypothetical protein Iba_chr05bCG7530 [Ipomoea batatas]